MQVIIENKHIHEKNLQKSFKIIVPPKKSKLSWAVNTTNNLRTEAATEVRCAPLERARLSG